MHLGLWYTDLRRLAEPDEVPDTRQSGPGTKPILHWTAPQWFYDQLNDIFSFTIDLAASPENAKHSRYYTIEDDALTKDWTGECGFLSPPFEF